jgi:hypothetical protein
MPAFASPDPRNLLVGRGKLFLDIFDPITGLPTGSLTDLGNITLMELSDKTEIKERYSSQDPAGFLLARVVTRQTFSIKVTGDEFSMYNLAAALNGVIAGSDVRVGMLSSVEAHVQFVGNPIKGPAIRVDYWHVSFVPTGNIGFIKDDFAEYGLEGQCIADLVGHPESPIATATFL